MKTSLVKKSRFHIMLLLMFMFAFPIDTYSQGPPPWAPANGYRAKTRHIYFPEYNFYFDLQRNGYFFFSNNRWSFSASVPTLYAHVNLRTTRHIELDFYGDRPYRNNRNHIIKYKGNKNPPKPPKKSKKSKRGQGGRS
jgi:hypothetical protein